WYDCDLTNNFTDLIEGEHSFAVNATDEFGYYSLSYFNWTIDVTPPIVNIVEGPEFIVDLYQSVNGTIEVYEEDLSFTCHQYVNGEMVVDNTGDYCTYGMFDNHGGRVGQIEVWIKATDTANNTGNWSKWRWNQINYYIHAIYGPSSDGYYDVEGYAILRNNSVSFYGNSSNVADCNRSFSWDSNKDGIIGTTQNSTTTNLTLGIHNITFTTSYSCNGEIWDFEEDAWSSINVINNRPIVDYSVSATSMRQYWPISVGCFASDFDGYVVKYKWALVNSSDRQSDAVVLYEGENPNTTLSNIPVGNHSITCKALDNYGDWNWVGAITGITILDNSKPEARIEEIVPDLAEYGMPVAFYGSASDDNFTIEKYEWSSNVDGELSNTPNFTTSSLSAGWHTISFRVRDPEGLWSDNASRSRDLYVNIIPTAHAGENVSTTPNVPIQFNGQGTDEDGEIVLYEWDFDGDGIYDWADEFNGRELNLYNNAGTYTAVLRVTDNDGSTSTDEVTVIVTEKDVVIDLGDGEIDLDNGTIELENGTVDLVETDEGLPSIGIMAAITSIGLIAVFRRK
ncbi:MAG TPA: PKD domain-containing protein, partial [Candidatus Poseidoniales archaeon]|nr:PKD domain-containing protein [Candidatus Poseidoniales archaeon]